MKTEEKAFFVIFEVNKSIDKSVDFNSHNHCDYDFETDTQRQSYAQINWLCVAFALHSFRAVSLFSTSKTQITYFLLLSKSFGKSAKCAQI